MAHIRLWMPNGGEDGYIFAHYIAEKEGISWLVRFDGKPYSQWDIGDDTPMIRLHSALETVNISDFQNGVEQSMTSWNKEWNTVKAMIVEAVSCSTGICHE